MAAFVIALACRYLHDARQIGLKKFLIPVTPDEEHTRSVHRRNDQYIDGNFRRTHRPAEIVEGFTETLPTPKRMYEHDGGARMKFLGHQGRRSCSVHHLVQHVVRQMTKAQQSLQLGETVALSR